MLLRRCPRLKAYLGCFDNHWLYSVYCCSRSHEHWLRFGYCRERNWPIGFAHNPIANVAGDIDVNRGYCGRMLTGKKPVRVLSRLKAQLRRMTTQAVLVPTFSKMPPIHRTEPVEQSGLRKALCCENFARRTFRLRVLDLQPVADDIPLVESVGGHGGRPSLGSALGESIPARHCFSGLSHLIRVFAAVGNARASKTI